jgi:hypothetical protein
VIGHALRHHRAPHHRSHLVWDRWIAVGFAVGSVCFFVGPFPGFVQLVGEGADASVFFAGSIFFTVAAGLELLQATHRRPGDWAGDASWWSAAIQFAGTLLFNISTFDALEEGLSSKATDRLVWTPDLFGSICFLVSGAIAYLVTTGWHLRPARRDREWGMAAVNLAGCVFFMISAIASFVVPSTGSVVDLAAANFTTALGALCFLIGAVLLLPRRGCQHPASSVARPIAPGPAGLDDG